MKAITELTELKTIELSIMKKLHRFSMDNGINYYLSHGTLIGAIRHNGFIPWDDDIDIFMPRPDYKKFCEIFPNVEKELGLKIVNNTTKPYYGTTMSKIIDNRTLLIELDYDGDDPIGVFVDIWPLDGISSIKWKRNLQMFICKFIHLSLILKKQRKWPTQFVRRILKYMVSIVKLNYFIFLLDRLSQWNDYDSCEYVTCFMDGYHAIIEKEKLTPILHKFEDNQFLIPSGYNDILTRQYGNYMQLPSEDKRIPHHIVNTYWKD